MVEVESGLLKAAKGVIIQWLVELNDHIKLALGLYLRDEIKFAHFKIYFKL